MTVIKQMRKAAVLVAFAAAQTAAMAQVVVTYGPVDVASVPTLSQWGMIIMAAVLAVVAVIAMRKGAALFWVLVPPWSVSAWGAYAGMSEPLAGRGPQLPLWVLTLWMVVMGTVVPFALVMKALGYISAAQASIIGMTEPLIASIIAWIALAEVFTPVQMVGGVIVLVGVYLAERAR